MDTVLLIIIGVGVIFFIWYFGTSKDIFGRTTFQEELLAAIIVGLIFSVVWGIYLSKREKDARTYAIQQTISQLNVYNFVVACSITKSAANNEVMVLKYDTEGYKSNLDYLSHGKLEPNNVLLETIVLMESSNLRMELLFRYRSDDQEIKNSIAGQAERIIENIKNSNTLLKNNDCDLSTL